MENLQVSSAVVLECPGGTNFNDFVEMAKEFYRNHVYPYTYDDRKVIAIFNDHPYVLDSGETVEEMSDRFWEIVRRGGDSP